MRLAPWTPVLATRRGIRVGLSQPIDLTEVSADERAFLVSLEGGRPTSQAERRRFARCWDALEAAGALVEPSTRRTIRLRGSGPVLLETARQLATRHVAIAVDEQADAAPAGPSLGQRVSAAAPHARLVSASGPVDLDMVISLGPPMDATVGLLAADSPHLMVMVEDQRSVLHLVDPGTTACAVCLGLERSDADPDWPTTALQCAVRTPRQDPALEQLTACMAATVAWQAVTGADTSTWRVDQAGVHERPPFAPHPECSCGAGSRVGDEVAAQRARMPAPT